MAFKITFKPKQLSKKLDKYQAKSIRFVSYRSVEDLRDNMSGLANLSEKDLGEDINRDLAYQQLMFMDPESNKAFNRVVRAVSAYNAPPDAEPWFKNQQQKYYTRLLRNWEAGGKTREDFLNRFVQERPY